MLVNIYNPYTLKLLDSYNVYEHNIQIDYAQNPISNFSVVGNLENNVNIFIGAIIEIIEDDDVYRDQHSDSMTYVGYRKEVYIPYIGIVSKLTSSSSFESTYIYNIYNVLVRHYQFNKQQLYSEISSLNREEFGLPPIEFNELSELKDFKYVNAKDTALTEITITDLFIEWFKQSNVTMSATIDKINKKLIIDLFSDNYMQPLLIKDNTDAFVNWEVVDNLSSLKQYNKAIVVEPKTTRVIGTYYAKEDGSIVGHYQPPDWTNSDAMSVDGSKKIKQTFVEYSPNNEKATILDKVQSAIGGYRDTKSLQFDVVFNDQFILTRDDVQIGRMYDIIYNNKTYNMILAGYRMTSDNNLVTLLFGYERETLNSFFKKIQR